MYWSLPVAGSSSSLIAAVALAIVIYALLVYAMKLEDMEAIIKGIKDKLKRD